MMDSEHILSLISGYVLGLLPAGERRRVEAHARQCPDCRAALQRERQMEMLVRGTVHQTAQPGPGRLLALRPAIPAQRRRPQRLYHQLAPVTLIAVLLALGLLFGSGRPPFTPPGLFVATSSATSTATNAPTVTATAATPKATLAAAGTTATAAIAAPVPLANATPEP